MGERLVLKYKVIENQKLEELWRDIKISAKANLPGKLYFLLADEHIFKLFPTGDLYISTQTLNELSEESLNQRIAHELAHMLLQHAQESLHYSKITALVMAWLCRNNHHFSKELKLYLLHPSYTDVQEKEANQLAKQHINKEHSSFVCEYSLKVTERQ